MSSAQRRRERRREVENQQSAEEQRLRQRIADAWQVPEHSTEEFVKLQDAVGDHQADAIADFVKSMIAGGVE